MWPLVLRTSPAHAEGGARRYEVAVQRFVGDDDGHVRAIEIAEVRVTRDADGRRQITPVGESLEIPCDLALLAIGFDGVEHMALLDGLGLEAEPPRGVVVRFGLADRRARCVRLRGRPSRGVADRLGDRRRPQRGARGRRLPDGRVRPAGTRRCPAHCRWPSRDGTYRDYAEKS